MAKKYNPADFVKALSSKEGLPPLELPISIEGFAKPQAEDPNAFMFSPGTSCSVWIPVSPEVIESVDHLGQRTCGDHTHEYIRLHLKIPKEKSSSVYAQLLSHQLQASSQSSLFPFGFDFCRASCRAAFPTFYDPLKGGLELAKSKGIIHNVDHCRSLAEDSSSLIGALTAAGLGSTVAGAVAKLMSRDCIRCCCEEVF